MFLHKTSVKAEKQLYYQDTELLADIIDKSAFSNPSRHDPFFVFPVMIFKRVYWLEGYYG